MHLDIEGYHTSITPHLLVRIFGRLQDLRTSDTTAFEARVTLAKHIDRRHQLYEVCVTLTGRRLTLQARQRGTILETTVETALGTIADQFNAREALVPETSIALQHRPRTCQGLVVRSGAAG